MFFALGTNHYTWKVFLKMQIHSHVGFPDIIACDQSPQFNTRKDNLLSINKPGKQDYGVDSDILLDTNEIYYSYLCKCYYKVKDD